jgi:hypothetical protein
MSCECEEELLQFSLGDRLLAFGGLAGQALAEPSATILNSALFSALA